MKLKYLTFIVMIYVTVKLIILALSDKILMIFGVHVAAGSLVIPVWFIIGDIIAEVYGYKVAKMCLYWSIVCQILFAVTCASLVNVASPTGLNQLFYSQAFDRLPLLALISCISVFTSGLLNAYVITKWKALLKGKHFILRSLGSSAIGELIFSFIAVSLQFFGVVSFKTITELVLVSLTIKLIVNPLIIIPSSFFVRMLKNKESLELLSEAENLHPLVNKTNLART
jgi:uncharacterized integral membrane protein (TIGR00697 family)